jgi:hypothetical protein
MLGLHGSSIPENLPGMNMEMHHVVVYDPVIMIGEGRLFLFGNEVFRPF